VVQQNVDTGLISSRQRDWYHWCRSKARGD